MFEPLVVDRTSGIPIRVQIRDHLCSLMEGGRLAEGDRLPTLRDMARQYATSMVTIQGVVRELQDRGVVRGVRGSGLYVQKAPLDKRRCRELRVSSDLHFGREESAFLRNEFQRVAPGCRIILSDANPDVLALDLADIANHAEDLEDVGPLIREFYGRSDDAPDIFGPLRFNGRSLMVPIIVNSVVTFLNQDLFERQGVPLPSYDWTWEDFLDIAGRLTVAKDKIYGVYPGRLSSIVGPYLLSRGGKVWSEDGRRLLLDSPAAMEFGKLLRKLRAFSPQPLAPGFYLDETVAAEFASGRIGMTFDNIWFPELMRKSGASFRWTARPLPGVERYGGHFSTIGFGIRKDSPVKDLARIFLRTASEWEKWPEKLAHRYGIRLHADMERHDDVEAAFKRTIARSRSAMDDITPQNLIALHRKAWRLLEPEFSRFFTSDEAVSDLLDHTRLAVEHVLEEVMPMHLSWA